MTILTMTDHLYGLEAGDSIPIDRRELTAWKRALGQMSDTRRFAIKVAPEGGLRIHRYAMSKSDVRAINGKAKADARARRYREALERRAVRLAEKPEPLALTYREKKVLRMFERPYPDLGGLGGEDEGALDELRRKGLVEREATAGTERERPGWYKLTDAGSTWMAKHGPDQPEPKVDRLLRLEIGERMTVPASEAKAWRAAMHRAPLCGPDIRYFSSRSLGGRVEIWRRE